MKRIKNIILCIVFGVPLVLFFYLYFSGYLSTYHKVIHYEYNGVWITRIDNGGETYFYYGNFNEKNNPSRDKYIYARHSGFDGCMAAYFIFYPNKKVEIIPQCPIFEYVKQDSSLFYVNDKTDWHISDWVDSLWNNKCFGNVLLISNAINIEKEHNRLNNTKVKAIYPKE